MDPEKYITGHPGKSVYSVDWSKYPPQPELPVLPDWHDTPEREACWKEFCNIPDPCEGKAGFRFFLAVIIPVEAVVLYCKASVVPMVGCIFLGFIVALVVWFIAGKIWIVIRELIIARSHGLVYMLWPKYRDIHGEVGIILANRPDFDEAEFRKYWPSEESAEAALEVLRWIRETWDVPDKMFYPNDPLSLLCSGKLIGDDEDFYDKFGYAALDVERMTYDNVFAELTEARLEDQYIQRQENKSAESVTDTTNRFR